MSAPTIPQWSVTDRMVKAREFAGLTQEQLAHRLGVSLSTVKRLEKGTITAKPIDLFGWAYATNVDTVWLATGEEVADADTGTVTLCYTRDCDTVSVAQIPGQMSLQVAA